nr:hypothetical protein [Tanacetum cinerariifolium]
MPKVKKGKGEVLEEKQLEEEQAAKAQSWKPPVCYDDDDDEDSSKSLNDNIISELPSYSAVTPTEPVDSLIMEDEHLDTIPAMESDEVIKSYVENLVPNPSESEGESGCDVPKVKKGKGEVLGITITFDLPTVEPKDSLRIGDEHLDTIPVTESNEFIKSSVENLVPNPSESEDLSDGECNEPAYDDFTTFSNLLFDTDDDFSSSDDESFIDKEISKKIYSNPLFDEEIISMKIDPHHFNVESDLIESLLNHDYSIISSFSKIDSLLNEFVGELILLKTISPEIDETDCDPEEEIRLIKKLLYDNSSPRPLEEFISENSDAAIKSFSPSPISIEDSDSFMEEIDLSLTLDDPMPPGIEEDDYDSERDMLIFKELLSINSISLPENESFHFDIPSSSRPPAKPPNDDSGILTVKVVDDISELYVPMPRLLLTFVSNQEKSPHLLPHQGFKAFQLPSESPMMIYGEKTHILDVLFLDFYPLDQLKLLNTFESSNDDSNVVNAPQEPFVFNQDPGENSSQSPLQIDHQCCYGCGDSLDGIFCQRCTYEDSFAYDATPNFIIDSPNVFNPPSQLPSYSNEFCGKDAQYGHDCPPQVSEPESSTPLRDIIISELPLCIAITPVLSTKEPKDSLIIGDEHLNTIPKKESDKFIKSSDENLIPSPNNFSSSDDESFSDKDIPKEINSNPLFDEEIISIKIDPHHFSAKSDLIESLLNQDSSIISSSKIDSLLDEFAGELIFLKSILSGLDETDCDPEEVIRLIEKLLYDNSSPRPSEEFNSENSDAVIESFSPSPIPFKDGDPFME